MNRRNLLVLAVLTLALATRPARAQVASPFQPPAQPDPRSWAELEHLSSRLEAAEAEIQALRSGQVEREDAGHSEVVTASYLSSSSVPGSPGLIPPWTKGDWQIVPFGSLTGEAIVAESTTTARAILLYLNSAPGPGLDDDRAILHGQTSSLGVNIIGPDVGPFQSGGMILYNFLGDRPALNQASPFFLRGYGELRNEQWRFTFGQQGDLFNPLNPNTVNFGGHKQAGNAGAFRGSLRVEHFSRPHDAVQLTLQAAVSQQSVNDFIVFPVVIGTDNGWPNVEGRIGLGLGEATGGQRPVEAGVSGVVGQTRSIGLVQVVSDTWGASVDAAVGCDLFGIRGEFLAGEAIGTYNAGIGQSLNPETLEAIRTYAGWLEAWLKLTDSLTLHVGYGADDPRDADLGRFLNPMTLMPVAGQRSRNEIQWANLMWNVTAFFDLGLEVSRRETEYIAPSITNSGMVYHFRSRLSF